MAKFFVVIALVLSAVGGIQQAVVKEMSNRELTLKIIDHTERIRRLEFDSAIYDFRISELETKIAAHNAQVPAPQNPAINADPLWGLLQSGMTEEEVQLLIGNPMSVGGGNSWNQWNYQAAGKQWKQWSYLNGGYVIFTKPEQNKQFGVQIPNIEEYKVEEWLSPKP